MTTVCGHRNETITSIVSRDLIWIKDSSVAVGHVVRLKFEPGRIKAHAVTLAFRRVIGLGIVTATAKPIVPIFIGRGAPFCHRSKLSCERSSHLRNLP